MRKSNNEFLSDLLRVHGRKYIPLEVYKATETKILIRHTVCNEEYRVTPHCLLMGSGCPKCFGTPKKTHDQFVKEIEIKYGDSCTVVGKYVDTNTKIDIQCNKCGRHCFPKAEDILHKQKSCCRSCAKKNILKKTNEEFAKEVLSIHGDKYILNEVYFGSHNKISITHVSCGRTYKTKPNTLLNGYGCCCNRKSGGEEIINEYLKRRGVKFSRDYRLSECKNKQTLPFDFAVFNKSSHLSMLIEYDGKQHYEPIIFLGGVKRFLTTKINDEIKNTYCASIGIPLIRIPYKNKKDISKILDNFIKNT